MVFLFIAIFPQAAAAKESYVQFQEFDWAPVKWAVGILLAASILVFILKMVVGTKPKSKPAKTAKKREQTPEETGFGERAETMGFRVKESKLLIQIAAKVAPHKPESLLNTANGREHLYKDLEKRARVREREVAVIRDVQRKLENMRGRDITERESKRIESNMPVWVVRKIGRSASDPDALWRRQKRRAPNSSPVRGGWWMSGRGARRSRWRSRRTPETWWTCSQGIRMFCFRRQRRS